jgi:hypothetical protein
MLQAGNFDISKPSYSMKDAESLKVDMASGTPQLSPMCSRVGKSSLWHPPSNIV